MEKNSLRLLVVDDEESAREIIAAVLSQYGATPLPSPLPLMHLLNSSGRSRTCWSVTLGCRVKTVMS